MKNLFSIILITSLFLFCSSVVFAATATTTGLTSLTLSNLYTSLGTDFLVLRVTGVGTVAATVTVGYRQTFDFGYFYVGAGSIPGQTVDFTSPNWTDNIVWQAEININLRKAGDYFEKLFKQNQNTSNSSSSSTTSKSK